MSEGMSEARQRAERTLAYAEAGSNAGLLAGDLLVALDRVDTLKAENERVHEVVRAERRTLTEKVLVEAELRGRVETLANTLTEIQRLFGRIGSGGSKRSGGSDAMSVRIIRHNGIYLQIRLGAWRFIGGLDR